MQNKRRKNRKQRKQEQVDKALDILERAVPGTAQWVWKCPDCGADIVAKRLTDPKQPETNGLLEFEHAEPLCPEFDGGESLEDITYAWLTKQFQLRTSGDGPS